MNYKKILIYSFFIISLLGLPKNIFAQINSVADGQIDFRFAPVPIFTPGGDFPVLRFQPDGKILAKGRFAPGLGPATPIWRFLPNGQPDPSFNAPTIRTDAFELQPDGKIVYSYVFIQDSYQLFKVGRLNPDGTVDPTFNFTFVAQGQINSINVLPDGKILIAGSMIEKVEENRAVKYVARLNADGSFDRTFGGDGNGTASKIITQTDGKILVYRNQELSRLNADGSVDAGFTPQSAVNINFFLLGSGKILVAYFSSSQIVRLNSNGTLDPSFQSQHTSALQSRAVGRKNPDGRFDQRCHGV